MRYTPSQDPARYVDPDSRHSLGYTFVASALVAVTTVAVVLAVSYPVAAAGAVTLAVAGLLAGRTVRRFRRTRRRAGRTRRVCVPKTGVCVEV